MVPTKERTRNKVPKTAPLGTVDWQQGMTEPERVSDPFARLVRETPLSPDSKRFLFRASLPDGE